MAPNIIKFRAPGTHFSPGLWSMLVFLGFKNRFFTICFLRFFYDEYSRNTGGAQAEQKKNALFLRIPPTSPDRPGLDKNEKSVLITT